jgi:hypothetical protein
MVEELLRLARFFCPSVLLLLSSVKQFTLSERKGTLVGLVILFSKDLQPPNFHQA